MQPPPPSRRTDVASGIITSLEGLQGQLPDRHIGRSALGALAVHRAFQAIHPSDRHVRAPAKGPALGAPRAGVAARGAARAPSPRGATPTSSES